MIGAGNEIGSLACGHTLDHPDFEQVFAPIFDAALRYLAGELIQTPRPKNGPVAATVMSIARARYTITVIAAEDWFNFNVGGLCLFEKIVDGKVVVRQIGNVSVTFDHRVVDGARAAAFTLDLIRRLESPAELED